MNQDIYQLYPSESEVDEFIADLFRQAKDTPLESEIVPCEDYPETLLLQSSMLANQFIKFSPENMTPFYAYWQPSMTSPAPLLVHTPGYGAELNGHPELVSEGYNVLHIQPLGYTTPKGRDFSKLQEGSITWPVMGETIKSECRAGYRLWLVNCIMAIEWAKQRPAVQKDRISFFGTSQGGGGSLLLASVYRDQGLRSVAANQPFLTNYPMADFAGAYGIMKDHFSKDPAVRDRQWHGMGLVDTISHAHRLIKPTLLTASKMDGVCPEATIQSLYQKLRGIRSLVQLDHLPHSYSREFIELCKSWFRIFG